MSWMRTAGLVAAILAATFTMRALRLRAVDHHFATQTYEDLYYVPPPHWLPVLSLGYRHALADLLFLRALVYFGDELGHQGDVRHVYRYADAILALDPEFRSVYLWAATASIYRTGTVTLEDLRRSGTYLERARARFPNDADLAWQLGAHLMYELAPHVEDPDERARIRERALAHLRNAAEGGAGPPWLALHNATQLQKLGALDRAVHHLEVMRALVPDGELRARIDARLALLREALGREAARSRARPDELTPPDRPRRARPPEPTPRP